MSVDNTLAVDDVLTGIGRLSSVDELDLVHPGLRLSALTNTFAFPYMQRKWKQAFWKLRNM